MEQQAQPRDAAMPGAEDGTEHRVRVLGETRRLILAVSVVMLLSTVSSIAMAVLIAMRSDDLSAAAVLPMAIIGLLYVIPGVSLLTWAATIRNFVREPTNDGLDRVLEGQRSFWRLVVILIVVNLIGSFLLGLIGPLLETL
ncbi:MAG: hypothetical protein KDA21_03950 [Phycisphaerales bacterium]|nr:hypothetical protein [Phycisphaerales bacterium]